MGEAVGEGAATRSSSQFTFQSYDCSSRSSTLPSSAAGQLPSRLIDLEETGDEVRLAFYIITHSLRRTNSKPIDEGVVCI